MHHPDDLETDEILGITRCVKCGQRLDGDIECPFCAIVETEPAIARHSIPLWVFCVASFLTSPISAWWVLTSTRLGPAGKALVLSGGILWLVVARLWWM